MIDFRKTLMRGDLVYNHRNWICPVVGMNDETITVIAQHYGKFTYRTDEIHPIPLTEEIILKLGWEEINENHKDYVNKIGTGKQFKHPWYVKMLNIRQNSLSGLYYVLNNDVVLRYLHDLQHILLHTVEDEIQYNYENDELTLVSGRFGDPYRKEGNNEQDYHIRSNNFR